MARSSNQGTRTGDARSIDCGRSLVDSARVLRFAAAMDRLTDDDLELIARRVIEVRAERYTAELRYERRLTDAEPVSSRPLSGLFGLPVGARPGRCLS